MRLRLNRAGMGYRFDLILRLCHAFRGPREVLAMLSADAGDGLVSAHAGADSEASAGLGSGLVPQSISRTRKGARLEKGGRKTLYLRPSVFSHAFRWAFLVAYVRSSQSLRRLAHGFGLTMLQTDLATAHQSSSRFRVSEAPLQSASD